MKKTFLMASALMFGASLPAFADEVKSQAELDRIVQEKFTEMDADKNGAISWNEADAADKSREDFNAADTNRDGSLSMAELKSWKQKEWQQSSRTQGSSSNERMRNTAPADTTR